MRSLYLILVTAMVFFAATLSVFASQKQQNNSLRRQSEVESSSETVFSDPQLIIGDVVKLIAWTKQHNGVATSPTTGQELNDGDAISDSVIHLNYIQCTYTPAKKPFPVTFTCQPKDSTRSVSQRFVRELARQMPRSVNRRTRNAVELTTHFMWAPNGDWKQYPKLGEDMQRPNVQDAEYKVYVVGIYLGWFHIVFPHVHP